MSTVKLILLGAGLAVIAEVAAARGDQNICRQAQKLIAGTQLEASVEIHSNYQDFVESKATVSPLIVQQYFSNPLPGRSDMATVVSCKMKTAERINDAFPKVDGGLPAAGDRACEDIHRDMLEGVLDQIPSHQRSEQAGLLVIEPEELTFMGPLWLRPWPFQPLSRDSAGNLLLRSRALYVPFKWWIPMPDRFKGTYYCHLIAPDFLRAVLRGEVDPGV